MKRALYITLVIINLAVAFLLALSYLSTIISPAKIWILAFFGLLYPYLLITNICFIFLWVIKFRKAAFISIIAIVIGWNHFTNYIPLKRFLSVKHPEMPASGSVNLRVLTYNVKAFNVYDWIDYTKVKENIINLIRSENPDIICLQEFYSENSKNYSFDNFSRIFSETPFHHIQYRSTTGNKSGFGMATFSRFPIAGKGFITFPNSSNMAIYTDIVVYSDTFRIYNNHLQSVNFRKRNYDFIDRLKLRYDEQQIDEIRDITRLLKQAFIKRSAQVDTLSSHIKSTSFPVIVCGDFNDTPVSYTYRKMRSGLKDSFVNSGEGTGNTYLGVFPSYRIDYIFHSSNFKTIDFERVKAEFSDHYPIICHLRYNPGEE